MCCGFLPDGRTSRIGRKLGAPRTRDGPLFCRRRSRSKAIRTILRVWVAKLPDPSGIVSGLSQTRAACAGSPAAGSAGKVNLNTEPRGSLWLAHRRPPCPSTIDLQIDRPSPKPFGFVE